MIVSCIVAMSENRVIGRDGKLPWRLPADLAWFKKTTLGRPMIMGRKTWESIGRPLPGRTSVVLTRQPGYLVPGGVLTARSLADALEQLADVEEVFVIGGAEVFRAALPVADWLFLTIVHADLQGDVFFPPSPREEWRLVSEERRTADEAHEYDLSFKVFDRPGA